MLLKTHLIFGLLTALLFIDKVSYKATFFVVVLIASILPDVDSMSSFLGRFKILRPLQWAVGHRGFLHSFSFMVLISLLFAFFIPRLAFPFFIGYGIHLIADSFTVDGIQPWWPSKEKMAGKIRTGGIVEQGLFYGILLLDVLLFVRLFI